MAETYKKLDQRAVPNTATTVYTVPSSTQAIVKSIRAVNTSASSATIKIWQGGTADANVILPATTIDAGGFAEWEGTMTMAAADYIAAQASAATSITMTINGLEIT
jgi:hypothetical protein